MEQFLWKSQFCIGRQLFFLEFTACLEWRLTFLRRAQTDPQSQVKQYLSLLAYAYSGIFCYIKQNITVSIMYLLKFFLSSKGNESSFWKNKINIAKIKVHLFPKVFVDYHVYIHTYHLYLNTWNIRKVLIPRMK